MTSVIIVQHGRADLTRQALRTFLRHHSDPCEIILVDNGSPEPGGGKVAEEFPSVKVLSMGKNEGFGRANNAGASCARGEFLLFLNNDTITTGPVVPAIEEAFAADSRVGIVGPLLRYEDGTFQLSAGPLPSFGREIADKILYGLDRRGSERLRKLLKGLRGRGGRVGWVTGAALAIRTSLFEHLGGFDHSMFMYFEDKDLCARAIRAGHGVLFLPSVSLVHLKGGSEGNENRHRLALEYRKSQITYYRKHRPKLEQMLLRGFLRLRGVNP